MIEQLDSRRLMTVSLSGGVLTILGSANPDTMYVAWYTDPSTGAKSVRASDGGAYQQFNVNSSLTSVLIKGGNSGDTIYLAASASGWSNTLAAAVPVTAMGEAGTDSILGSSSNDTLYGGSGNDTLWGGNGNDYIDGEVGADSMFGEAGLDTLIATNDSNAVDSLSGGSGADRFYMNANVNTQTSYDVQNDFNGNEGDEAFFTYS